MTDSRRQNIRAIAEQAADWYLRVEEEGGLPLAERQRFVSWLKESPTHIAEFMRVRATHAQFADLDASEVTDVEELLHQARSNVIALADRPSDAVPRRKTALRGKRIAWATAASVAAAALLFMVYGALRLAATPTAAVADNIYETALGEQRSVLLSDGSVVELNTQSRLRVFFTDEARLVELAAGEAVFDVANDPGRPFRVAAGNAIVEAVGTRFNVYRQSSQTVVTVIEGRVAVSRPQTSTTRTEGPEASAASSAIELASGNQVSVSSRGAMSSPAVVDPTKAIAWTDRRLVFDGDSLTTVARELNRYNRQQLVIADAALAQRSISGVFDANDPDTLLAFLASIGGMRVETDPTGDGWTLYPAVAATSDLEQR